MNRSNLTPSEWLSIQQDIIRDIAELHPERLREFYERASGKLKGWIKRNYKDKL